MGENVLELGNRSSQYPMGIIEWHQDVRPECHTVLRKGQHPGRGWARGIDPGVTLVPGLEN